MPAKPGRRPLTGYTIEEAAYHEAGHAVLALACQATVRSATIKPRRNRRGRVIFDSHLDPKTDLMMLVALAGNSLHSK
jgi:ATP-dependent Zn protease